MKKSLLSFVILGFLVFGSSGAGAQESPVAVIQSLKYRDLTGDKQLDILMSEELVPGGSIGHSVQSDGDKHDVELDSAAGTIRYHVDSPSRSIKYTVTRTADVLNLQGILAGASISKNMKINPRPWYEAIERSLHVYVVTYAATGVKKSLTFWIVQPWEAKIYLLEAQTELQEQITVNGREMTGIRVRVKPVGLLGLVWSSLYWYRPSDGRFLRYEAMRGGPGTPKSVVEFVGKN